MCLILFAFKSHPDYKLILAANRDEFYNRPTAPAHWWEDSPFLLAGKDLKGGGTWMGITKDGKIAAITNYRSKDSQDEDALSRGVLVSDYLSGKIPLDEFLDRLPANGAQYNGFNLVFGDIDNLYYFSNREAGINTKTNQKFCGEFPANQGRKLGQTRCVTLPKGGFLEKSPPKKTKIIDQLKPGIYGVSNAFLDTPWPKVEKGKQALERQVHNRQNISIESIFSLLKDSETFPDDTLPNTGIGIEYERMLSPLFIETKGYGTRSSTVILVDNNDRATYMEKSFVPPAENTYRFKIEGRN